ncbi:hypothetical protein AUP43_01850 [Oceanibaculum pacificum]|uniref:Uncharacterized protein n=1 Tax=Oceanibaculum pacificum TaxID=580166 RepID=A0A154W476_9PROT|nr:hypothetical protein AUP43_01850 [Oceanibaculum pacificum]
MRRQLCRQGLLECGIERIMRHGELYGIEQRQTQLAVLGLLQRVPARLFRHPELLLGKGDGKIKAK